MQVVQAVRAEFATPINAAQSLLGQGQLDEAMRNVALAAALPNLTPYETMLLERTRAAVAQRQGNSALVLQALDAALSTGQVPPSDEVGLVEALVSIASRLNEHARVLRWTERYAAIGGTQDAVRMVRELRDRGFPASNEQLSDRCGRAVDGGVRVDAGARRGNGRGRRHGPQCRHVGRG